MSSDKNQFMGMQAYRKKFMEIQLALEQDIENLLLKYKMHSTFSFSRFCDIWIRLKFGLIYTGKYRSQEFGHYTEMVFFNVKRYLMHSDSLYVQVGAIYLLYALYYKNPFLSLVKIRLLKDEFLKLQELIATMKSKHELEVLYIYNKMLVDQVFDFTATHYALGIETKYLQSDIILSDNILRNENNVFQRIDTETNNVMDKIFSTDEEYKQLLKKYADIKNVKITTHSINLREEVKNKLDQSVKVSKPEPAPSTSMADKRRALRNKGFKHKEQARKPAYKDNFDFDESD